MHRKRRRLRLKAGSNPCAASDGAVVARPTLERRRQAAGVEGGVARLDSGVAGVFCHGVRYPLLVDRLYRQGVLDDRAHGVALRARDLFERAGRRAPLSASYGVRREGQGPFAAEDPMREAASEAYRRLELAVLRQAGRDAWVAFVAIVLEDRRPTLPAGARPPLAALAAALAAAERRL